MQLFNQNCFDSFPSPFKKGGFSRKSWSEKLKEGSGIGILNLLPLIGKKLRNAGNFIKNGFSPNRNGAKTNCVLWNISLLKALKIGFFELHVMEIITNKANKEAFVINVTKLHIWTKGVAWLFFFLWLDTRTPLQDVIKGERGLYDDFIYLKKNFFSLYKMNWIFSFFFSFVAIYLKNQQKYQEKDNKIWIKHSCICLIKSNDFWFPSHSS